MGSRFFRLCVLLFLTGCVPDIVEYEDFVCADDVPVTVRFDVEYPGQTKGVVAPQEDALCDMNLYAFCDGKLVAYKCFADGDYPSLELLYGHVYNLYAFANVGPVEPLDDEDDFKENCVCRISEIWDLGESLPMSWQQEGFVVRSSVERVGVELERLVSKVCFSVDKTALEGLQINSIRVCQSPRAVWPFRYDGKSRVEDESDVFDGDYASSDDLRAVNVGDEVCFYVLENCQGRLLEENDAPWMKVPEKIKEKASVCTYLEIGCSFRDGYFYSGDVTYRIYLGGDNVSDFNIIRNSVMDVSLFLTDDGLGEISWRVDADVSINGGYAHGWFSRSLHNADDLYIGERFVYSLYVADEMMDYFGGDIGAARLCVVDAEGVEIKGPVFEFDELVLAYTEPGWNVFEVDGLCVRNGEGMLGLSDDSGRILALLEEVVVKKPRLRASDCGRYDYSEVVENDVGFLNMPVNGEEQDFCLYLIDEMGYNLNVSRGCGFELSLFDLAVSVEGLDEEIGNSVICRMSDGENGDDGPLLTFFYRCVNSGSSDSLNSKLIRCIADAEAAFFKIRDSYVGIESRLVFGMDYCPITLTLVDNGWAGYADCQLSMLVDNPSGLPIDIQCWQLNVANDDYNAIMRNQIVDLYGQDFVRECHDYVCGSYASGQGPVYCSVERFRSDVSHTICPMPALSTTAIMNSLIYDYMGQDALSHHIDAVFADGSRITKLSAVDKLSDGSMKYTIIYGDDPDGDGWTDRGIWLYSAGLLLSKSGSDFDGLNSVTPVGLDALQSGNIGLIKVAYDVDNECICAYVESSSVARLQVNVEVVVKAEGYVQTTPKGTMLGKVDNYCSASVSRHMKSMVLNEAPSVIDGGAVRVAMNEIYSNVFPDSYNLIGASNYYDHCAHPTSLEVSLNFSLAGDSSSMMVPIEVVLPSSVTFYHSQEDATYSVSVKTQKNVNSMAFVENLKM